MFPMTIPTAEVPILAFHLGEIVSFWTPDPRSLALCRLFPGSSSPLLSFIQMMNTPSRTTHMCHPHFVKYPPLSAVGFSCFSRISNARKKLGCWSGMIRRWWTLRNAICNLAWRWKAVVENWHRDKYRKVLRWKRYFDYSLLLMYSP